MKTRLHCLVFFYFLFVHVICSAQKKSVKAKSSVTIVTSLPSNARIEFGALKLLQALQGAGYRVERTNQRHYPSDKRFIVVGTISDTFIKNDISFLKSQPINSGSKEAFSIASSSKGNIIIAGADYSGSLYGCLELAERIRTSGNLPDSIFFSDAPQMVLRGECVGLQKSTYLPGRKVYE